MLNADILCQKKWRLLLKVLETAILVYVQHHVTIIFAKIRENRLDGKNLRGCLPALFRNSPPYFKFPQLSNRPYYRHPSVCCGQQVLEKFPVNSALCHVQSGCLLCIYIAGIWEQRAVS